MALFSVNLSHP